VIASILRDSPILAGAIAILVAVFLFLIIAILGAHRKAPEDRPRPSRGGRREPDFRGDTFDIDDFDRDYGPREEARYHAPERRSARFGFGTVAFSFVLGLAIGLGGIAAAPNLNVGSLMSALLGMVEAGPSTAREQAEAAPPAEEPPAAVPAEAEPPKRQRMREAKVVPKEPDEPAPPVQEAEAPDNAGTAAAAGMADEREERLTRFVDRLKGELPKPVGPTTILASVDRKKDSITLGYSLSGVPTDLEILEIQEALKTGVVDTFCKGRSDEARFLNDNGVAFRLIYTDRDGRTIARLTAKPRFCDSAG
jgi:hypothetical protein